MTARTPQPAPHLDDRGAIQDLHLPRVSPTDHVDLQVIRSRKGAVRGNHRHREGWHYCYVLSGKLVYTEELNPQSTLRSVFGQGEMFFTDRGVAHRMEFLEETMLLVIGDRRRDQREYEADLERVAVF